MASVRKSWALSVTLHGDMRPGGARTTCMCLPCGWPCREPMNERGLRQWRPVGGGVGGQPRAGSTWEPQEPRQEQCCEGVAGRRRPGEAGGSEGQCWTDHLCPPGSSRRPLPPLRGPNVTIHPKEIRTFFIHFQEQ